MSTSSTLVQTDPSFNAQSTSSYWLADNTANRYKQTYFKGFVDMSGSLSCQGIHVNSSNVSIPTDYLQLSSSYDTSVNSTFSAPTQIDMKINNVSDVNINNLGLNASVKNFEINHPLLDNHRLRHTCVETPQVVNMYHGKCVLKDGMNVINLDQHFNMTEGTFNAINKNVFVCTSNETDFDKVKGNVSSNLLTIISKNTTSIATIAWNVFGIRNDTIMNNSSLLDTSGNYVTEYKFI